jgi:hypothetical protein
MKRIYACFTILAVIFGLAVWGGFAVRSFKTTMEDSLCGIAQEIPEDAPKAVALAEDCLQAFRGKEHILSIFIRRDYLANLDVSLCAIQAYAAQGDEKEAMAEIARANSQVYAMCHLFLRML